MEYGEHTKEVKRLEAEVQKLKEETKTEFNRLVNGSKKDKDGLLDYLLPERVRYFYKFFRALELTKKELRRYKNEFKEELAKGE